MLNNCEFAQQRWGGISSTIDKWLRDRQQTLVAFCELSEQVNEDDNLEKGDSLRHMCQLLVDYVSAGHFEVYDRLVKESEQQGNTGGVAKARQLFQELGSTTEYVLDFNDKYQEVDDLEALEIDLSQLGEVLANRFDAEDQAIDALHVAQKEHTE